jgi:hypothetical protein
LENKNKELKNSNETVALLSLRINYIITQKFLDMTNRVLGEAEYRHLNEAFDCLID